MNQSVNLHEIIANFKVNVKTSSIHEYGNGHINDTYLFSDADYSKTFYILQKINHEVFKDIEALLRNIWIVTNHLRAKYMAQNCLNIENKVLRLIPAHRGEFYYQDAGGDYWRMYNFIENAQTFERVTSKKLAFEGGKAFGRFQTFLSDLLPQLITPVLPGFMNMEKRIEEFEAAVTLNPKSRVALVEQKIKFIRNRMRHMCFFQWPENVAVLPVRVIHNDTKFNNVLFDMNEEVQCVIDLDTVMPGYVAFDFGDAVRTIINTGSEDEANLEHINLDIPLFRAFTRGYMGEVREFITVPEVKSLIWGVLVLPFMQALRFLTDYLLGDVYYKTKFEGHNLQRANAQIQLFCKLEDNQKELEKIIREAAIELGIEGMDAGNTKPL